MELVGHQDIRSTILYNRQITTVASKINLLKKIENSDFRANIESSLVKSKEELF